jgi:hypothetical protein
VRVFFVNTRQNAPHPSPLPEYREREWEANATALQSPVEHPFLARP